MPFSFNQGQAPTIVTVHLLRRHSFKSQLLDQRKQFLQNPLQADIDHPAN